MIANGQSLCKAKNKTSSITIVYKKCEVVYSLSVLHVMHMHTARPVVSVRIRQFDDSLTFCTVHSSTAHFMSVKFLICIFLFKFRLQHCGMTPFSLSPTSTFTFDKTSTLNVFISIATNSIVLLLNSTYTIY